MKTSIHFSLKLTVALLLVVGLFGAGFSPVGHVSAASCTPTPAATFDLYAKAGTATLYGTTQVNILGYSLTAAGAATLPGPQLVVNQGDCVQVTLHNSLPEATALIFQGQNMLPDTTGVTTGSTSTYIFSATNPGTFLYEAGLVLGKQHQVAMGMYGAFLVRSATSGTAYGSATTTYNQEAVLVLSEIDTTLNTVLPAAANATPASFDMRTYAPKYFLINGQAYAAPFSGDIAVTAGNKVLLRYVNAGLQSHAMSTLGVSQSAIAVDGYALVHPHSMVTETIATGQTLDTLVSVPTAAANGTRFAVYDANLMLRNSNAGGLGGMLTFLTAGAVTPPTGDKTGPAVSGAGLAPNPTNDALPVTVSATVSDVASGNHHVVQAEFYIDSTAGSPTAMTGTFGTPSVTVSGTISPATLTLLTSGIHTIYIRGLDDSPDTVGGNWGPFLPVTLNLDKTGPTTSGLTLSPNPSTGLVSVALNATGSDVASGNSNVTAAEYWVDAGAHTAMTAVGLPAATTSFTATIPAGLSMGTHVVSVRSQDAFGYWGTVTTINLLVGDTAAPTTSGVSASPNPNNGTIPLSTSVPAVRVLASFSDVATGNSNLAAAEGFIDAIGATGTGFAFIASDGTFNSPTETGYADIPLAVVNTLTVGNHTIYVHAQDAAGNWNNTLPYPSTVLLIDKTVPTLSNVTVSPSPTNGAAAITATVTAADAGGAGLNGGEYWFDASTTRTAFSGTTSPISISGINISALALGNHSLNVRVKDAAGNWSTSFSRTFTKTLAPPTASLAFAGTVRGGAGSQAQRTTTLTITLSNSNAVAISGVGLTDNLPQPAAGTFTIISSATTCGGTTSTQNTNRRLLLTGGTIPANGSCTVTATVRMSATASNGPYTLTNTIVVGGVTSSNAGSSQAAASAVLTVNP